MKKLFIFLAVLGSMTSYANTAGSISCDVLRDGESVSFADAGLQGHTYVYTSGRPFHDDSVIDYSVSTNRVGSLVTDVSSFNGEPKFKVQILKMNQLWDYNSATVLNETELSNEGDYSLSTNVDGVEFSLECNLKLTKK